MWRRGRRTRTVLGALTLAYGLFMVVSLPLTARGGMIGDVVSVGGPLGWLVGISMPWVVLGYCGDVVELVGLFAAGVGLLLTRERAARIGLRALTLALGVSLLFVPGAIALLSGQAILHLPANPPAHVVRELTITMGTAWIAMAVVFALYVLWVRREWQGMVKRLNVEAG